jgi:signal peptidase II
MAPLKDWRLLRYGAVVLLVLLDQWSKSAVYGGGAPGQRLLFGSDWLSFWNSCNGGAAFGQFSQFPTLLVIGRGAAVLFLGWLLWRAEERPRLVLFAMTLVLAGALGNLVDNLWTGCPIPGHPAGLYGVRDFVAVDFGPLIGVDYHFPAFNLADSCITVGACAWILAGFRHRTAVEPAPAKH